MKRSIFIRFVLVLMMAFMLPVTPVFAASSAETDAQARTYTVWVGSEDAAKGIDINAFFPATLHVHVGDTVLWKQNANEIHTVTFLAGTTEPALLVPVPGAPAGAMMLNPLAAFKMAPADGMYDGSTYANSGIMGREEGQAGSFSLTFTKAGTYNYGCVVHGITVMAGTIGVDDASVKIANPGRVMAQARKEMAMQWKTARALWKTALRDLKPDTANGDGTTTHYVMIGFSQGQIDLMAFFPRVLKVNPGDTIVWELSPSNMAPHTVTFLNGAEEPSLIVPVPQAGGPPFLTLNPEVALPKNADQPLTRQVMINSGIIDPSAPGAHTFTLKVGNASGAIPYLCMLHDASGMRGMVVVQSK